ncbi:hypothetical protein CXB51_004980 [Gossypium anomalum]|uniref:SWIM-type domain-containing protein n=1 Tax=Gossypium anomalum TaxID=47600 RepID=A0A8J5Z1X8_9ROSI|nr:hypothetical protein CXB51_004980 [Gossypium anomalum]
MSWDKCMVHIHLGETLVTNPCVSYVEGEVLQWDFDLDLLCYYTLCEMVVEVGCKAVRNFIYREGGIDFSKRLNVCYDNQSFIAMINHIRKRGSTHVYVEHEVDTPDVVGDTILLHATREKDVNIRNGEPNCNEELNCNERVNGRVGKTFTKLSGKSNVEPDFSGSSYACGKSGESSESSRASDIDSSLGNEEALGVEYEDEEVRNIKAWYRKYKGKKQRDDGLKVGESSERGKKNGEVSDPSGKGIDYVDSSDLKSYGSDSDGEVVFKRSRHVCFDPNNPISYLELGMVFRGLEEFKTALAKIYAAIDNSDRFYKIKTFIETHECSITFNNKKASYKFVGEYFLSKIRVIPKLKLIEVQKLAKEELKVDLSRGIYSKARKWALEEINERVSYKFNKLWDYANALRKTDPDDNIERELLCAMGRDSNDQIYPISWSVVENKSREIWRWFFSNLSLDLQIGDGSGFIFMSDKQKGLMEDIFELLPRVEHRVCQGIYMPTGGKKILEKTCNKHFERSICDATNNNFVESFNVAILGARSMSIISMLEEIRQAEGFEVTNFGDVVVVDLFQWSCSCRRWDLTGIPCPHAINTSPPTGVAPTAPFSPSPVAPTPPAPTTPQIVASETSLPPILSTQPTPPTMPTSLTQQILTRFRNRGKQFVQRIVNI